MISNQETLNLSPYMATVTLKSKIILMWKNVKYALSEVGVTKKDLNLKHIVSQSNRQSTLNKRHFRIPKNLNSLPKSDIKLRQRIVS